MYIPSQKLREEKMQDIITVNHLSKSYGNHRVLEDVSFNFAPGQIIGLLGPNGSGKSSLIKILTGLIHDYSGEVLIDGDAPSPATKAKIAYLPEKSYLADWMRAIDAINYIADFYPDFDRDKALKMLDTFKLSPKQKIKSMSKGMHEKLQLILVMCRNAQLYIFDEPLSGVDPAARAQILDLIMKNHPENATMLISTHLIHDVESIFDHVLMIGQGKVLLNTSVDEIKNDGKTIEDIFKEVFAYAW